MATHAQNAALKEQITEVIHPYGAKRRVRLSFKGTGRTKQSFKDECDINTILRKYQKTGAITHANNHQPEYGFATSLDFKESIQLVADAQQMFNDLPSSLRTRFSHDPAEFLAFVQDPENMDEMRTLGLTADAEAPAPPEPAAPPASPDPTPPE